jgi:transcriptional regulator GlxA family with amidase domain
VAGLNVYTLCRHFLKEFGIPPQAWHRQLRVQEGARLLRDTRLPTKVIAARLGFADAHHFSRVFREHMGLPPRRYRALSVAP